MSQIANWGPPKINLGNLVLELAVFWAATALNPRVLETALRSYLLCNLSVVMYWAVKPVLLHSIVLYFVAELLRSLDWS